jgi:NitT/TauT family transport system substrate-binding protein
MKKQGTNLSRWMAVLCVCLAGLLVFGCSSGKGEKEKAASAGNKTLRIGYLVADQLHHPAIMVMKERKMLEAKGVTAQWGEFLGGAALMQEMASGSLDFGCCGVVPVMITRGQGVDVVALASANKEGSSLIVKDSIKTIKDLDGKNIGTPGVGSIQDAMVEKVAKDNGIKITRKSMKVSDMPIFLQKGEIDGFIAWAPHPARAVDLKYGHELLTSHDILPEHQCCVVVAKGGLLKSDPALVRTVLQTYLEAYKWFFEHQDEAVAMVSKVTGMDPRVVRTAMKTVRYPDPPYCNVESMKLMAQGLAESGKVQKSAIVDLDGFMKDLYRPQILEELVAKK